MNERYWGYDTAATATVTDPDSEPAAATETEPAPVTDPDSEPDAEAETEATALSAVDGCPRGTMCL